MTGSRITTQEGDPPASEKKGVKATVQEEFVLDGRDVNASGHPDQLHRQYSIWSTIGLALSLDGAWIAVGGSFAISVANGGAPGMIYEFLTACFWYFWLGACLAELASSFPTAGGVYHWACIASGPKKGRRRAIGFYAGSLNFFGWLFGLASAAQVQANAAVQLYGIYHPDLFDDLQPWKTYVAYVLLILWVFVICAFFNRFLPMLQTLGLFLILGGCIAVIIVIAIMPETHASNSFVWTEFVNFTGWDNFGIAFLIGCLNGAWAIGTPDAVAHMAEELRDPRRELPIAIISQISLGTVTAFAFLVAITYSINDMDAVVNSPGNFPLAEIFAQATNRSQSATFGLLIFVFLATLIAYTGVFLTTTRALWSLARDRVTPCHRILAMVNTRLSCPIPATVTVAVLAIAVAAINLGSKTAFNDLAGAFITLTTTSYGVAIAAHLFTGRSSLPHGWFWMGKWDYFVQSVALLLTIFFNIMFCFPFLYPVETSTMNYNSVILAGVLFLTTIWWFIHGRTGYPEPKFVQLYWSQEAARET